MSENDYHTSRGAHSLSQYNDSGVWVVFCKKCSAEGDQLTKPCPGKYVETKKPPHGNVDRQSINDLDKPKEQD